MKYNHPKIVDTQEIKDPSLMDLLIVKQEEESKSFIVILTILSEINFNDYEDITLLIPEDKGFERLNNELLKINLF